MEILKYMLIFIPISFIAKFLNASDSVMFILSCLSIIPLAGLMGEGTEEISFYSGPKIGGFLNGTFGNATELIISIFALKEGLFDVKYKKTIPKIPKSIGVITSETGAVIRDIINVIKRRYPKVNIKLYPVKVQGQQSKYDICEGIKFFNKEKNVDTIIVGRGGGSIEELWSFNEEMVAREVFNSKIPIISAVGHETDFTICDFVADMRAPTPSAAAEIATPNLVDLEYKIDNIKNRLTRSMMNQVNFDKNRIDYVFEKINNYLKLYTIKDKITQIDKIYDKINFEIENTIGIERERLKNIGIILHNLSPLATLDRGYSIVHKNNEIVNSIENIKLKEILDIKLKDGNIKCSVESIEGKEV